MSNASLWKYAKVIFAMAGVFIGAFSLSRWYASSDTYWKGPERRYFLSAAVLNQNGGYHTRLLSISDREIRRKSASVPYDQFLKNSSATTLSGGLIWQEFCTSEKFWTLLVGGNLGTGNRSAGTAQILSFSPAGSGGVVSSTVGESTEHRFRDCEFGKIGDHEFLASVTQGDGYLYLYDFGRKSTQIIHLPFIGQENNSTTTLHFVNFADLDDDGTNEIYVTSTTPEFGRFLNFGSYHEGTIYQIFIDPNTGKFEKVRDVWVPGEFVKRIHPLKVDGNEVLLWGIEGEFNEDGSVKKPFSIYLFDSVGSGSTKTVGYSKILELPHKECKEISSWNVLWNVPSIQIGCDNGTFYAYSYDSKTKTLTPFFRFVFGLQKMNKTYVKDSDLLQFWDIVQVHAIFWDDFDRDGKDELLVWVNNTGLYSIDFGNVPSKPEIREIFGISREYPEYFGRLTIFSIDTIPLPVEKPPKGIFTKGMESSALRPLEAR